MDDIIWGIEPYLTMFGSNQNDSLYAAVSEDELMSVMKSFKKDKCSDLDGWTIDIYIHFFDLMKNDILSMIEETRIRGNINHVISSTFNALIPKKKTSLFFADYKPISLCNTIYKIISKIIAGRI